MNMPFTLSLVIAALCLLVPLAILGGPAIVEALRKRSPDSLRLRDRLADGRANAKLAVTKKVAASARLVRLLGSVMWLAPSFSVCVVSYALGVVASPLVYLAKCAILGARVGHEWALERGITPMHRKALSAVGR